MFHLESNYIFTRIISFNLQVEFRSRNSCLSDSIDFVGKRKGGWVNNQFWCSVTEVPLPSLLYDGAFGSCSVIYDGESMYKTTLQYGQK